MSDTGASDGETMCIDERAALLEDWDGTPGKAYTELYPAPTESAMNSYLFHEVDRKDAEYLDVTEFALPVYESRSIHSARQVFPGYLCMTRHEHIVATCGYRSAKGGLFLEQFMEVPADRHIEQQSGTLVPRESIAELGSIRVKSPALGPRFAKQIEQSLQAKGFAYVAVLSKAHVNSVAEWTKARVAEADIESIVAPRNPEDEATLVVSVINLAP